MADLTPPCLPCPSCRNAMGVHVLSGVNGGTVELDLCFACQGMWFDPSENLKLAPAAVAELFKLLHEHRDAPRLPMASKLGCPRCKLGLTQGFDVVRTGRYITYRCANGHGRFSPFSSFMIEKGFVRPLTRPEIDDIARAVGIIHCTSCGAPVDLRKDHACPHCRSAFSLLDPQAVEKALQGYAKSSATTRAQSAPDLADALIAMERERERSRRANQAQTGRLLTRDADDGLDLLAVGIALVWKMLD
ncbi:MAG: zf-TFIIB domain-containing protein [Candidatus Saccharibacteria bacterium]|nr:zf-TFIIB domain-containing protein [Rhodoferax sp.]